MITETERQVKRISASELDAVLDEARTARWRDLALLGPHVFELQPDSVSAEHTFHLSEPIGSVIAKLPSVGSLSSLTIWSLGLHAEAPAWLTSLTSLESLDLNGNQLGDTGARALTALTGLRSLDLGGNEIGPDGAQALTALTALTSLQLGNNHVGDEGARALTALPRLTSLDLAINAIGDPGARAVAGLRGLTSLGLAGNWLSTDGVAALATLTGLTRLDLRNNRLGDAAARALVGLTGLATLHLRANLIRPDGARALAGLTGLAYLDLGANPVGDAGAHALAALPRLCFLDLFDCGLGDAGARALAALADLTTLRLAYNQIGDAGAAAVATLGGLVHLNLGANRIGDAGARALAALPRLSSLDLAANAIGDDGACALAALTSLTSLDLSGNAVGDRGATALASLAALTSLDLAANAIGDDGACALASLTALTSLDLAVNKLGDRAAHALTALTNLTSLNLRNNLIGPEGASALLDTLCDAAGPARLTMLALRDNRDMQSVLPPAVLASGDAPSVLATYRRYRKAKQLDALRPLNEAKLVVVGNEAVGKTSLIRYLLRGEPRDPDEQKTPGAAIHEKIEVSTWSVHQSQIRLNVWDFGGQEIMRGTHRFFLTERSLYLLVMEDRREDDRSIYEWLEIIAQRGGSSPVIVVINKCDGDTPRRVLDEAGLQRSYPVIEGFARTSCNTGASARSSIAALRAQIAATLSESARLEHVRDPIPRSWLRVKDAMAGMARARSVLPVRDFERLCDGDATVRAADRITDVDEQRALLGLLHDLGVVVTHGLRRDVPAIWREITVLDPNWLTGAIYTLINSPLVREQGGELRHDQIGALLDPGRYPQRWHELIISMMQEPELGLCLPLAHGHPPRYLLPDALPVGEPDYEIWPAGALRFRFQYNLLPTGFLPRLIVEAHRSLTDRPTWWRTGVVLGIDGCHILVRGDTVRNRVEIHVAGTTGQRAALSVVRNYFDAVHRYYANLPFRERVPLPEQPDVDVGYEHLLKLEHEEGLDHTFLPEDAHRKYAVRELLEGVRDDGPRRLRHHVLDPQAAGPRQARAMTSPYRGKIDVGILTIREDENTAVLRRFPRLATESRQRRYRLRSLALPGGGAYTLAVLRCLDQGNTDAQAAAHALLEDLAPRFVLVVGIAGGVPSHELSLGDVVVASRIADFSVEAVIRDREREYALGGGPLHPDAARLAADLSAMVADGELDGWNLPDTLALPRPDIDVADDRFYGDERWKQSVRQKIRQFAGAPRPPRAITGAIASSDRLIKDDETLSVWLKIARQVVAVEMESAGIYKATHERGVPFLAIRGISDVVGFSRAPAWTAYACETAAAFTQAFLRSQPIPPLTRP